MSANNLFLSNLSYDTETGQITFGNTRYQVIRPEVITDFQKAVEAEVGSERCAEIMAIESFKAGTRIVTSMPNLDIMKPAEKIQLACIGLSELGWGRFEVLKIDMTRKEIYIEVWNSAFAACYGQSGAGVCHMIRGLLAGLATHVLGESVTGEETKCVACGDDRCRFMVCAG